MLGAVLVGGHRLVAKLNLTLHYGIPDSTTLPVRSWSREYRNVTLG